MLADIAVNIESLYGFRPVSCRSSYETEKYDATTQNSNAMLRYLSCYLSNNINNQKINNYDVICIIIFSEDISLHKQLITHMLTRVPAELFSEFLRVYLLQTNQTPLRSQTHSLVLTMYEQGTDREKNNLLKLLWPLWPQLSQYGKKGL